MRGVRQVSGLVLAATVAIGSWMLPARADDQLSKLLADGQGLQANVLAAQRGGSGETINMNAVANVNDNINIGDTGTNTFGSFGSAQGVISVLQNTGNNVAMQNQIVVNVNLH